jgi:hypothetical protein
MRVRYFRIYPNSGLEKKNRTPWLIGLTFLHVVLSSYDFVLYFSILLKKKVKFVHCFNNLINLNKKVEERTYVWFYLKINTNEI